MVGICCKLGYNEQSKRHVFFELIKRISHHPFCELVSSPTCISQIQYICASPKTSIKRSILVDPMNYHNQSYFRSMIYFNSTSIRRDTTKIKSITRKSWFLVIHT